MSKKLFRWISLEPDLRKWKPSRPVFEPQELFVMIDVPDELVSDGGHLSIEGMRYCINRFESGMSEKAGLKIEEPDEVWGNAETGLEEEEWE